jgi:GNAT superfamily N-acetyltransferase
MYAVADFDAGRDNINQVLHGYSADYSTSDSRNLVFVNSAMQVQAFIITFPEENKTAQRIGWLGVDRRVQKSGLGRQLVAAAVENFCVERVGRVNVDVYSSAVPFYERLGFRMASRTRRILYRTRLPMSCGMSLDVTPDLRRDAFTAFGVRRPALAMQGP